MKKNTESKRKARIKLQDIPNYGLIQVFGKGLQKQLDDLNEVKRLSYNTKNSSN